MELPHVETIGQLMMHSPVLQRLVQRSKSLQLINRKAQNLLPQPLSQHCYVANLRDVDNTVVIHVDTSIWATQLRFFVPDFIGLWQQDSFLQRLPIDRVETKVRPFLPKTITPSIPDCPKMLMQTAKISEETTYTSNQSQSKASLLKLANHGVVAKT
jgi:hypothetical protein